MKKLNSKERFKEKWGVTYSGFQTWLSRNYQVSTSMLPEGQLEDLMAYYKQEVKELKSFKERHGVSYCLFRQWLEFHHDIKIGDLNGEHEPYVSEYKWTGMKNKLTKDEMWEMLWKVVCEKPCSEEEIEIYDYLSGVEEIG